MLLSLHGTYCCRYLVHTAVVQKYILLSSMTHQELLLSYMSPTMDGHGEALSLPQYLQVYLCVCVCVSVSGSVSVSVSVSVGVSVGVDGCARV
jgi:hypothetical protein